MDPKADDLIVEMEKLRAENLTESYMFPTRQAHLMAQLLVLLAKEQEQSADKMEQQTERLIQQTDILVKFTRWLYGLTVALLILGVIQLVTAFCH